MSAHNPFIDESLDQCCGSVPLTNESGGGRPKTESGTLVQLYNSSKVFLIFLLDDGRIRSRIQEARKHTPRTLVPYIYIILQR